MTPEGRVKKHISGVLKMFPNVYSFMPVQFGMGASGVDYHCVVGWLHRNEDGEVVTLPLAFFIEAKKPDGEPTDRQERFLRERQEKQGCKTFVIDEDPSIKKGKGLKELTDWLREIEIHNAHCRDLTR